MNKTVNFMIFVVGAAVGSIVTWRYIDKKYEQIAQEEIDSVKEVFAKREQQDSVENNYVVIEKAFSAKEKPNIVEYTAKLREHGYTNYADIEPETKKEEEDEEFMDIGTPYVIPPEEFGEFDDYEAIGLTYYADQVLTDDDDELIEDIEDTIGFDSLNHFGEYEDDSVFVRNDRLKCDYEILLDHRKYSDVVKRKPHEVID